MAGVDGCFYVVLDVVNTTSLSHLCFNSKVGAPSSRYNDFDHRDRPSSRYNDRAPPPAESFERRVERYDRRDGRPLDAPRHADPPRSEPPARSVHAP